MSLIDSATRLSHAALEAASWRPDAMSTYLQRAPVADGVDRMLETVRTAVDAGAAGVGKASAPGGRELVATEDSVDVGGHRDAYELRLYREADGENADLHRRRRDGGRHRHGRHGPGGDCLSAGSSRRPRPVGRTL